MPGPPILKPAKFASASHTKFFKTSPILHKNNPNFQIFFVKFEKYILPAHAKLYKPHKSRNQPIWLEPSHSGHTAALPPSPPLACLYTTTQGDQKLFVKKYKNFFESCKKRCKPKKTKNVRKGVKNVKVLQQYLPCNGKKPYHL